MESLKALKEELRAVVKQAPDLPADIKKHVVYVADRGEKIYLNAYIPFIGERYGRSKKILFYCVAQALSKGNDKYLKEYAKVPDGAIDRLELREPNTLNIDVGPIAGGILPALAGVLLYMRAGLRLETLSDVLQHLAVTNYYKYSLWTAQGTDLNPDDLDGRLKMAYDEFCFENFIKREIAILKPDYIFVCGKRGTYRYDLIDRWIQKGQLHIELQLINDPAYLLHGGKVGSDTGAIQDKEIKELIDRYCQRIKEEAVYRQFAGRLSQIRSYLSFYQSTF